MKKHHFLIPVLLLFFITALSAQKPSGQLPKPKLVVGIVIDQMRWDYLYRFNSLFSPSGGFKRMLDNGFTCENTLIPYAPTVTACGHASIYTGSVPAIHGITGNTWQDKDFNRQVYCTEDTSVISVGTTGKAGIMSPKNMLTTTITDELRISSNFKSKVIGVALKDRGSILPAGHAANAAYWYDGASGNFITSSYYMNDLPKWVKDFNAQKMPDALFKQNWTLKLPADIYSQYATDDSKEYEGMPFGSNAKGFPYDLSQYIGKDYSKISSTPYGSVFTLAMATAALKHEQMGKGNQTDFLAVSLSSPDYIGHSFGPNSWEVLDCYIRLDEALGEFFKELDNTVGAGNYVAFLTADHGVAHVPGFMKENKLPGGLFEHTKAMAEMNAELKMKYGIDKAIISMSNFQVHLNNKILDSDGINKKEVMNWIISFLEKKPAVSRVFETSETLNTTLPKTQREMLANGFYPRRNGEIQFILKSGYIEGGYAGTTHGLWNPYDSHIPLVWYGWGVKKGKTNRETYMTDIAATLAAMLQIQMPSGSIGKVIEEVMK